MNASVVVQDRPKDPMDCIRVCVDAMAPADRGERLARDLLARLVAIAGVQKSIEIQRALVDRDFATAMTAATDVLRDKRTPAALADSLDALRKAQTPANTKKYVACLKQSCDSDRQLQIQKAESFVAAIAQVILDPKLQHAAILLLKNSRDVALDVAQSLQIPTNKKQQTPRAQLRKGPQKLPKSKKTTRQ